MLFGLTGTPATFSRLMDKVLDGLISKNCLVYLDDVIIFVSSFEETLANLKLVMGRLRDHNLLCKARICELFEMSIAFLGHVMSEEGIATDPEKICNLSAPKDKSGIRSILGLGNYYKRFIKSYCVITAFSCHKEETEQSCGARRVFFYFSNTGRPPIVACHEKDFLGERELCDIL